MAFPKADFLFKKNETTSSESCETGGAFLTACVFLSWLQPPPSTGLTQSQLRHPLGFLRHKPSRVMSATRQQHKWSPAPSRGPRRWLFAAVKRTGARLHLRHRPEPPRSSAVHTRTLTGDGGFWGRGFAKTVTLSCSRPLLVMDTRHQLSLSSTIKQETPPALTTSQ